MSETKPHPYDEAIKNYREAIRDALEVADDPFKPPELTVATGQRVLSAIWNMQMEYMILTRKDD